MVCGTPGDPAHLLFVRIGMENLVKKGTEFDQKWDFRFDHRGV